LNYFAIIVNYYANKHDFSQEPFTKILLLKNPEAGNENYSNPGLGNLILSIIFENTYN